MKKLLTAASLLALTTLPSLAEPLKIGVITTLSGPAGYLGEQVRDGLQLAIDQEGGKLGGVDVELVVEDDGLKPGNGLQIADKFLNEEGIKLITGIIFSNVAGATVPEVVENDAIYISPNAAPSSLAGAGCNKNYFVVSWQNDSLHEATGAAAKALGYKKVVALAPNYQAGKDAIAGFKREFGGDVTEIYTQLEQTDFAPEMAQIRAAAPDAVFQFHPGGMGIAFLKQYVQAGLSKDVPMIVSEPSADGVILGAVGEAAVGLKATTHWNADFDNDANKAMVTAWAAKHPDKPLTTYGQQAYDVGLLIASALKKTGGIDDLDAFRAALKEADFASTRGDFKFGQNQHPVQDWYMVDIVAGSDGKPVWVTKEKLRDDVGDVYAAECKM
ncbi:ABC transporter substrate-binding protein [Gemmobacter lutimaris]|uniref:ABC transporter substrate-binding protein n=1 Tax=Gemmobacter lutimaris TaxID=2306023 RepID=A0A398BQ11_9RHOB|nr:ABC transporter substrate-binding protein [Gemmobacter lutimaris]RID90991.1 ABC transporter substrate-binding protein [Gemmobacter lutimaris]